MNQKARDAQALGLRLERLKTELTAARATAQKLLDVSDDPTINRPEYEVVRLYLKQLADENLNGALGFVNFALGETAACTAWYLKNPDEELEA